VGTRADFYVGRGESAEWIGSIAWDGYPDEIPDSIKNAKEESVYREQVARYLAKREDATVPEQGWPWLWLNSRGTDYAYAFDGGVVYGSKFGRRWFNASEPEPENHGEAKTSVFPDMTKVQKPTLGKRSGITVFSS